MAKSTFTSHGMTFEINDNSEEVLKALKNAEQRGLETIGQKAIAHAAESLTASGAVDTGLLRNSLAYAISGEEAVTASGSQSYRATKGDGKGIYSGKAPESKNGEMDVYIGSNLDYAEPVEVGARGRKARPYIVPAARDHTQEYRKILQESFENA